MSSFISFENVEKRYGTGEVSVQALHDASFTIEKGEICVVVGQSGAGKTTLLNILGGMDTLTEGHVLLDGRDISTLNEKQMATYRRFDIGFVFQFIDVVSFARYRVNIILHQFNDFILVGRESKAAVPTEISPTMPIRQHSLETIVAYISGLYIQFVIS